MTISFKACRGKKHDNASLSDERKAVILKVEL
jgi:hypothetical protein